MCGIIGVVGRYLDINRLQNSMEVLQHRGPDDGNFIALDDSVFLGHKRLSIIDLSPAGKQPMSNEDNSVWIIYNGEIYNFLELRVDLESRGHKFKSRTDTEVIIHLYEEKGEECVKDLKGMFAFALWDRNKKVFLLARDRLGIKPLYYTQTNGSLLFASEIKALLQMGILKKEVDLEALDQYLTFLWVPDPKTIFKGIYKLPPAHYMVYKDKKMVIKEYWDLRFVEKKLTEKKWIEKILNKFEEVIKGHLISDVPLGLFLSGGLDSSTILAFMSKFSNGKPIAYTTSFRRKDLKKVQGEDDLKYAQVVAKRFNTEHIEITLDPDIVNLLPKAIYYMDEPIADTAAITTYLICRAANGRAKVLLSGMGGDELFAGYPWNLGTKLLGIYNKFPRPFSSLISMLTNPFFSNLNCSFARRTKKFIDVANGEEGILGFRTYFTKMEKERLYAKDLAKGLSDFDPYIKHREYLRRVGDGDLLAQMLYLDVKTFLPCLNLAYTDKMSMANSIEVRVPFLDYELVELAASIPSNLKIRGFQQKYIYKKAMRNLLPNSVITRKKIGFGAPVEAWLDELKPLIGEVLSKENIKKRGYFNYDFVKELKGGNRYNWMKIWQLLTLEIWHRTFIDA